MAKRLIARGLLAGGIGGLIAFVFARIIAEPLIQKAIDYESARDDMMDQLRKAAGLAPGPAGPDIFSRHVQRNIGIGVGMIAFGIAMGAMVAVVFALCLGRTGRVRPKPLALLVAAAGYVTVYLVPFAKYPANPPAIGHEETIRSRGSFFLVMMLASVITAVIAVWAAQRLSLRMGTWNATIVAGLGYLAVMGILMAMLPDLGRLHANLAEYGSHATETPLPLTDSQGRLVFPGFPADVLAQFRVYSMFAQLLLWGVLGIVFAPLAERIVERRATAHNASAEEPFPALV
ncbi:MAG TPA: CbtA family protein [Sporichthyaceae bacterium]|jgi:predicted cobalt transporter CbtA|nr:CbtA family protein [Sporichthyaceae bacterium]